jgi:hypothetical protein
MGTRFSGHPSLDEHIARLGRITHFWNDLEFDFQFIPMLYSTDILAGLFVTRLAPSSLAAATKEIIEHRERNPHVKAAVYFALAALEIIRENRNILVHSLLISATSGTNVAWVRRHKARPWDRIMSRANLRDLGNLEAAMVYLREYVAALIERISFDRNYPFPGIERLDKQPPLPRRFPMPRKLAQIP